MKVTLKTVQNMTESDRQNFLSKLEYEYCSKCKTRKEVDKLLNCQSLSICTFYNIKKSKEQLRKTKELSNLRIYGVTNPAQAQCIKDKTKKTWENKSKEEKQLIREKVKKTNLERYGSEKPFQSKESHEKYKQTMLNKYGVEHNWCNGDMRINTFVNSLGVENPFQAEEIKEKIKQTCLDKYNVEHPMKSEYIKNKVKQTKLKRYGTEWGLANKIIINKSRQTCLKKYGYPTANQDPIIRHQQVLSSVLTNMERYGVPYYCMTRDCINKQGNVISKINQRFANLLKENNIYFEQEFVLGNRSYDFKIGNTFIEINPTYSHNSTTGGFFKNYQVNPKNKNYHLEKSKIAQENGFFCIHIFDWDDWNKIINLLLPKKIIYARNCEIKKISKKECDEFLNLYHLQNTCKGQLFRYGLYYNSKLIELMTFGKPRYNKKYEWELLRLCSHKDYKIVGGSEKLFKHFLREQNPKSIISYCDYSKFSGEVYKRLGMTLKESQKPSCVWSKGKQKITNNLLMQRGYDQLFGTSYGKGTSNRDLMIQNGWREVYDCGQITWVYN